MKQKKVSSRYDFSTLLKNGCARTLDFARSRTVIATGNLIDFVAYSNSMESSSIVHISKVEFKCGSLLISHTRDKTSSQMKRRINKSLKVISNHEIALSS
jgi:hypothetical protein